MGYFLHFSFKKKKKREEEEGNLSTYLLLNISIDVYRIVYTRVVVEEVA